MDYNKQNMSLALKDRQKSKQTDFESLTEAVSHIMETSTIQFSIPHILEPIIISMDE